MTTPSARSACRNARSIWVMRAPVPISSSSTLPACPAALTGWRLPALMSPAAAGAQATTLSGKTMTEPSTRWPEMRNPPSPYASMICLPWGMSGVTSMSSSFPLDRCARAYAPRVAPLPASLAPSSSPRILECRRFSNPAAAMQMLE